MTKYPKTIAVDLTPVLPGGENGGAKIFVLDLLKQLSLAHKNTNFILLTQAASHEELAALDCENVSRKMVLGPPTSGSLQPRLKRLAMRAAPRIPSRIRRVLSRVGYRINTRLKRSGSSMLLKHLKVDLLFCPFTAPTYFESGIPTVCTVYDLQYKTYPEFFAPAEVAHRGQTFDDAARRARFLAAISNYSRESAIEHGKLDPARVRTIHLRMAHRISPKSQGDTQALSDLGLTSKRYIVYPANFWKHKNHEMLLAAFGIATGTGDLPPDMKLVCTGSPGERQRYLINAASAMGLGDRIVFPGYLSNEILGMVISNSSGVVFPSLYEGFGLPVIEAMAANVPVACSNTTSLPEVASDAAILFDPRVPQAIARAISSLVNDEPLRNRLVEAGKNRVREFSDSERMANEYWQLFLSAVSNGLSDTQLSGVTNDGWIGSDLYLHATPLIGTRNLELTLSIPNWVPQPSVTMHATLNGMTIGTKTKILRGTEKTITVPLDSAGGEYVLEFSPTFVPSHCGYGDDQRKLAIRLERCRIVDPDNQQINLYPESN